MKSVVAYLILFAFVFILTYTLAPALGLVEKGPPSDRVIQTPFQDWRGSIRV